MSLATSGFLFWFWFGLALSLIPFLICLLIMHVLMPKAVLDRYWKEPHFRPFELMLFSGWSVFAPMRTMMFMSIFVFPRLGQRRGILEPHRLVPRWYRIVSIVLCVWVTGVIASLLTTMIGFDIYSYVTDSPSTPDWQATTALIFGIACFVFVAIRQRYINRRNDKAKRERSLRRNKDKLV